MFTTDPTQQNLVNVAKSITQSLVSTYQIDVDHGRSYKQYVSFREGNSGTGLSLDVVDDKVCLYLNGSCLYDELNQTLIGQSYSKLDEQYYADKTLKFTALFEKKLKAYFGDLAPLVTATYQGSSGAGGTIKYCFDLTDLNPALLGHLSQLIPMLKILPRVSHTQHVNL